MQPPPQNPYGSQPPQQPTYPQQQPSYPPQQQYPQQPPYGQQPYGYSREYRPAGGRYGVPGAQVIDYIMGILLMLLSIGGIVLGILGFAASRENAAKALAASPRTGVSVDMVVTFVQIGAGIMIAWCVGLLLCSIGIIRFKKAGMIACGVMSLLAFLLLGAGLGIGLAGASQTQVKLQGTDLAISIGEVIICLVYTIYGFARAGAAN